jgi:hypothetical protein
LPADGPRYPAEAFAAQLDVGLRAANETVVVAVTAWSAVFRAYVDTAKVARELFGGLLIDWHQRLFAPPGR